VRQLIRSFVFRILVSTARLQKLKVVSWIWTKCYRLSTKYFSGSVRIPLHGQIVIMNFGYAYPLYLRTTPSLNYPLIELVYQSFVSKGDRVNFVDVGAAIGDTILLLLDRCPNMTDQIHAIEGDDEFFHYLRENLDSFPRVKAHRAFLSSSPGTKGKRLVRTHPGTASAQGEEFVRTVTLDDLLLPVNLKTLDVLKIDVDGSDGKVLLGAAKLLRTTKPAVIFEWHPLLCKQTGNNWIDHFRALDSAGYDRYLWFTKYGTFSHYTSACKDADIDAMAELCLDGAYEDDWHYDIIALHKRSRLRLTQLAGTHYARTGRHDTTRI